MQDFFERIELLYPVKVDTVGGIMEKKILVTGGDERQIYLAEALEKAGFEVTFVNYLEQMAKEKIERYQVLVLQIAVSKEAISYCSDVMRKGQKIYGGLFPDKFVRLCEEKGVTLFDYMKENTIAIKNAVATAEGAIAEAIIRSKINLHGSQCLVVGFGRCGEILADKLSGLKCNVTVMARDEEKMARAFAYGYRVEPFKNMKKDKELQETKQDYQFIFNTVPALVVDRPFLEKQKNIATIIDIASAPGGVDYEACKELGIQAKNCLGLPGKYAPIISAHILAEAVMNREREDLK